MKHLLPFVAWTVISALASCSDPEVALPVVQTDPDQLAALAAVQHTFDGLAAHDSSQLASVVLPEANFQRWASDSAGTWRTVNMTGAAFTSRLGQPGPAFLERTWDESIRVDGDVAVFSAPYDFWVDQTCSHCGYDAIVLLRTEADTTEFRGWRIASLAYTIDAVGEEACRARFSEMPSSPD